MPRKPAEQEAKEKKENLFLPRISKKTSRKSGCDKFSVLTVTDEMVFNAPTKHHIAAMVEVARMRCSFH